jgi:hypothetical protein
MVWPERGDGRPVDLGFSLGCSQITSPDLTIAPKLSATAGRVLAEQQKQQLLAPALRGDLLAQRRRAESVNDETTAKPPN